MSFLLINLILEINRMSLSNSLLKMRSLIQSWCRCVIINQVSLHIFSCECRLRNNIIEVSILRYICDKRNSENSRVCKYFVLIFSVFLTSLFSIVSIDVNSRADLRESFMICRFNRLTKSLWEHSIALSLKKFEDVWACARSCEEYTWSINDCDVS